MAVLLVLASLSPMYVEFQYTKTAALVTAAGYILVFCSERKKRAFIWRDCLVSIRQLDPVPGIWHDQYCSFRILAGTGSESMEEQRLEDSFL